MTIKVVSHIAAHEVNVHAINGIKNRIVFRPPIFMDNYWLRIGTVDFVVETIFLYQ